jgi:hypothetical protein
VDTKRRLLFTCLALQAVGLFLGLLIPLGEATLHGILLLIATIVLLFPGSVLAVLLNAQILPQQVIQSQRVDSVVNLFTAVVLNCLLLGVVTAILRRRTSKG